MLKVLQQGRLTELELAAASGTNWLGLTPGETLAEFSAKLQDPVDVVYLDKSRLDFANVEDKTLKVIPLLLQTGLLTFKPAPPGTLMLSCVLPNEYARRSVQRMIETAVPTLKMSELAAALLARSPAAFNAAARQILERAPNTVMKAGSTRELLDQPLGVFGAMYCALPCADATVSAEYSTQRGKLDILVEFHRKPEAMWIVEVGIEGNTKGDAADTKLQQAQQYAKAFPHTNLYCCAVLASARPQAASTGVDGAIATFAWSRRVRAGENPVWEPVDVGM